MKTQRTKVMGSAIAVMAAAAIVLGIVASSSCTFGGYYDYVLTPFGWVVRSICF